MPQIINTEYVAASPATVWAFISDFRRIPEWVTATKAMLSISTAETELGTEYRELSQIGPVTSESSWHVTTFRAPHMQIHESRSMMANVVLTMTVEPEGNGTRLTFQTEYRMLPRVRPVGRLLEWLTHRNSMQGMQQTIQQAKRIIEQEDSAAEQRHQQPLETNNVPA